MTRETKIGLLVGLAFIIVIGILLSDHLTSSNEPPQATLAVAGNNVRSGVTTPGAGTATITTPVAPSPVAPSQTVNTPADLQPRPQPVQPIQVAVGGPSNNAAGGNPQSTSGTGQSTATSNPPGPSPVEIAVNNTPDGEPVISKAPTVPTPPSDVVNPTPTPPGNTVIATNLQEAARQHGEELISIGGIGNGGTPTGTLVSARQAPVGMKQYVAVEGDSLGRMASRLLGSNNKANRDAIINANASLKQNSNLVVSGRTYNIPVIPAAASPTGAGAPTVPVPTAPQVTQTPTAPIAPAANENWYTVKEGDSLWRIATEQCGSAAAITAIKELNKMTSDTVVSNTKLRLPARVATAN